MISNYFPDRPRQDKDQIKDQLRKKLLFEEEEGGIPADDLLTNKTDERSDDLVAN